MIELNTSGQLDFISTFMDNLDSYLVYPEQGQALLSTVI